jgi:uncharacterized membrane protein (DUF2068 family)
MKEKGKMENKEEPKKPTSPWGYIMMTALLLAVLSVGIFIGLDNDDKLHSIVVHISSSGWLKISVGLLAVMFIASRMFKNRDKSKYK